MKTINYSKESFDELVDFLLENGNEIIGDRWDFNKEGFHTYLKQPINWSLVYGAFIIDPNSVCAYENTIRTISDAYEVTYQRSMLD